MAKDSKNAISTTLFVTEYISSGEVHVFIGNPNVTLWNTSHKNDTVLWNDFPTCICGSGSSQIERLPSRIRRVILRARRLLSKLLAKSTGLLVSETF